MDKNINIEITEENNASASIIEKRMNVFSLRKIGVPVSLLFPPGTVKIAANITVVISAATSMQDDAVSFIHFSPSLTNSLCSSVNSILGVRPFESLISLYEA
ncbi:hypothetical protein RND71_033844 [Anisodus tanguticus]|uniref:Uncharacterized protein n=1 Tax=Anisodus tanguticus TaxID=243964 RepID=A0AAE1R9B5_9SOLA|nr:hypothetical protein RND71_033844 [Anisodus tanguticus]